MLMAVDFTFVLREVGVVRAAARSWEQSWLAPCQSATLAVGPCPLDVVCPVGDVPVVGVPRPLMMLGWASSRLEREAAVSVA